MNSYNAAELMLSEDSRYRLLVDSITDYAIYMMDRSGRVTSWNAGARRFKGYEAHEIIGRHFSEFYTDEDRRAGVPAIALQTAADEGRFEQEGWRVRKNGERFWAHVIIDAIRDASGQPIAYAKITRDLTERLKAREALRASEEQFRLLVQGVSDYAIYMLDADGLVSSWNSGAERIKGYSEKEILGKHFSQFYTEEDRAAGVPQKVLETARAVGRWEQEGWRVRKDGTRFFANVVVDAIRDEFGRFLGFAKVTRDVSERTRSQQALEQAQRALFQSQKLESLGQVTGGIAHDFNNLLTAVLTSLDLARKRVLHDPKALLLIDNAVEGAERGAMLTQRMLAFARRQELKLESVCLPDLVQGMMSLISRSVGPLVKIETRFPAGLPRVLSDPNQLENALLNLALNSRDAMPSGGTLSLEAQARSLERGNAEGLPAGDYVLFGVNDTGTGMDARTLASAVEPFFTTKGIGKGTGLGLSMVQGLAEQAGGTLVIASTLGKGTQVGFWLPQTSDEVAEATAAAENAHGASERARVLLVDDDLIVLRSVNALLEAMGHDVLATESGLEALRLVAQNSDIDLLITDQMMPEMTGTQLIAAMRRLRPHMPALIVSGYAELTEQLPVRTWRLTKPFKMAELIAAIAEAVRKPGAS